MQPRDFGAQVPGWSGPQPCPSHTPDSHSSLVWQAARLSGFSQYQPSDGRPAEERTDVLVWYGPDAIYFGIRAYERHGAVAATLADRDRISSNDHVELYLDTFNDHRPLDI